MYFKISNGQQLLYTDLFVLFIGCDSRSCLESSYLDLYNR